jgi:tyrosyl-DNA phosphodiesterase 2
MLMKVARHDFLSVLQKISLRPPIPPLGLNLHGEQSELHQRYMVSKARRTPQPIQQGPPKLYSLQPRSYRTSSKKWEVLEKPIDKRLERGSVLKVVSWNIDMQQYWVEERTSAALKYLRDTFGVKTHSLVIMFQEVCTESLRIITENPWVQENFMLSNIHPPQDIFSENPDKSVTLKWKSKPYFTLMLASKDLSIMNSFRVPFETEMGRDALAIDIPLASKDISPIPSESLRLCTTHLESLGDEAGYRPRQLSLISTLLKGSPPAEYKVVAGLVGGDMNAIKKIRTRVSQTTRY